MNPDVLTADRYKDVITVTERGVIDESCSSEEVGAYESRLKKDPRVKGLLIHEQCLQKRIFALADDIIRDHQGSDVMHLMVVLTGSIFFAADLSRYLYERGRVNVRIHLIKTSVYDKTIKKSGEHYRAVTLELDPREIEGKNIIVLEDITDQGFTLTWLRNYLLSERNVASVRICSLLDKELRKPSDEVKKIRDKLMVDYTGFKIPDVWVAGYGVDAAQEMRNLPCIVSINESLYQ
ncbi:MAG TPA: phosphoribosyltransferase family protein [Spirochaetota bacterium]|nr:phosphoribosyltransferase family protein [Spirochaetota bacterium]HPI88122.1 phosphoribosyltransferase family protein [Spirochaetota bacterium]HPR46393.1 phosphoribosyltransferase family protein [Spirochaetota bacterium]